MMSSQLDLGIDSPITSFELTKEQRNVYVRTMLNILIDKYLVDRPRLARTIGMSPAHLSDFVRESRTLSNPTLDLIEEVINDLYEPLVLSEIKINQFFIRELIENTEIETENSYKRTFRAGIKTK